MELSCEEVQHGFHILLKKKKKKKKHFVWLRRWTCTVRRVPQVKFLLLAGKTWYSQLLVKVHIHLILTVYLRVRPSHPQLFLPVLALRLLTTRVPAAHPAVAPRAVLGKPVWYGHDEAEETQADAVHLGCNGDVGKEGVVPAHENAATFKVFDDVEDLLALRLPHHSTNIQQGGDVLLPVGNTDAKRKKSTKVSADAVFFFGITEHSHHFGATGTSEDLFLVRQIMCLFCSKNNNNNNKHHHKGPCSSSRGINFSLCCVEIF